MRRIDEISAENLKRAAGKISLAAYYRIVILVLRYDSEQIVHSYLLSVRDRGDSCVIVNVKGLIEMSTTVRVMPKSGEEKLYTNAFAEVNEGLLDIYHPSEFQGGRAEHIAGWWMNEISMWEYVEEKVE